MEKPLRNMDWKKIYLGVAFLCVAVLLMLMTQESPSRLSHIGWVILFGVGLLLYLWGRFFSRGNA